MATVVIQPGDRVIDDRSYSIHEFCLAENLSHATYFKIRKAGRGPREMHIPGSSLVRISHEARLAWKARNEKNDKADEPQLKKERAQRAARGVKAGRASIASPKHHSRRGRA